MEPADLGEQVRPGAEPEPLHAERIIVPGVRVEVAVAPAGRALNLREAWLRAEVGEVLTALDHPLHLTDKLVRVVLRLPEEVHEVAVQVIQDLMF